MSDYLVDERDAGEAEFTRRACDPRTSAVVEACAGSGKTWLLVGRIVRALLDGAAPGEILAITFTRRAAQEMRTRLLKDLRHLAAADDAAIVAFLEQRGMGRGQARHAIADARQLFERVLCARVPLTIQTFHGWFWQLAARAPLGAGVPFAPVLLESTDRLRSDAWLHFSAALVRDRHATERAAWETLIDEVGDSSARKLLDAFLDKRAEWWSFAAGDEADAVQRALAPLRAAGDTDPAARVREPASVDAMRALVDVWLSVPKSGVQIREAIERAQSWLGAAEANAARDFRAACLVMLTKEDRTPRKVLLPNGIGKKLVSAASARRYADAHRLVVERLGQLISARHTWRAFRINEAVFACGRLLIASYQRLKAQQQGLDFTDLEWHAYRLLADEDNAAYMQARLDARYRHILLDEFQDTNPLQWQVLQSWLAAYGAQDEAAAADRPRVLVVGDPKQSIYRFRRAEPRVFDAALRLLMRDFGASHLRTNVTRRNAERLTVVLNLVMPVANPLYQKQSTRAAAAGEFVLLPLTPPPEPRVLPDGGEAGPPALRDVLTVPRDERERDSHYREGRVIANEISHALTHVRVTERDGERAARWSDALVLVRRRTHLADYERALRDAGVPFVSDRRGGLLATLEADDLTALLQFLTAPFDDLKLAHALRSPIFTCTDLDLMQLAQAPGSSWWQRLQALGEAASVTLVRARELLRRWQVMAGALPVHDLLDRVYFEADVRRRYASIVPAAMHAQVQANLDAFIELALNVDAGRYPSLPRFIDQLAGLKRDATDDAPDEGASGDGDAVRVMTIHGAKGLEAEIVVLADAHSASPADTERALVVWPPDAAAPEHVSLVARGADALDGSRAHWFAQEDAQRVQEDWNLLYVATTRARQVLIVSGAEPARGKLAESWYTRLLAAQALSAGAAAAQAPRAAGVLRTLHDFVPAPMPTGARLAPDAESEVQRLGRAWHALLELGPDADVAALARQHALSREQAEQAAAAAARVRASLPQFFTGRAQAELELVAADGGLLRLDRLVETDAALWIIDFKWRIAEAERAAYEAQVRRYGAVLSEVRRDKPVRLVLVTAEGALFDVPPGG